MPTAEEILMQMDDASWESKTVLRIDNDLRTITIPPEAKIAGVTNDQDVNKIFFAMPRFYDGTDLSTFIIRIPYKNGNGDLDAYTVKDVHVVGEDIEFTWIVSRKAALAKGTVSFSVCARRSANGVIAQEYGTAVHTLTVLEGLCVDVTQEEEETARDILAELLAALRDEASVQRREITAVGTAQKEQIEKKGADTLATIPTDYTDMYNRLVRVEKHKAAAIIDTSAKAASHAIYAQEGDLSVTLHGVTIQPGEGDPSPDNVREISSLEVAQIRTGGKNLFSTEWETGGISTEDGTDIANVDSVRTVGIIAVAPGIPYAIKRSVSTKYIAIRGYDKYGKYMGYGQSIIELVSGYTASNPMGAGGDSCVFKVKPGVYGIRIVDNSGDVTTRYMMVEGIVLPTAYEPYNATIQDLPMLPDGQPLYGGDKIVNDWASGCDVAITLDGSDDEGWIAASSGTWFYLNNVSKPANDLNTEIGYCVSNRLPATTYAKIANGVDGVCAYGNANITRIGVAMTGVTDIDDFKTKLAANPLTVYYRSTDFKPENELRLCRVERNMASVTLDGSERIIAAETGSLAGETVYRMLIWIPKNVKKVRNAAVVQNIKCSHYPTVTAENTWNGVFGLSGTGTTEINRIYIYDPEYNSDDPTVYAQRLAELYTAGTPVEIVYELATPEVYCTDARILPSMQLMPETVCGSEETEVKYHHDTKHYIDQKFEALAAALLS